MIIDISSNQVLWELAYYLFFYSNQDNNSKRFKARVYITYHEVLSRIIMSLLMKEPINSYIKWYEEMRKSTTGQGKDYTTRCLLDYKYIKNHYKSIGVDLNR